MADAIEDALAEIDRHNEGLEAEEPAQSSSVEPAPKPDEKPRFSLDDVILDDPRLPDSLRGKPASALFDDRHNAVQRAHEAGFEKNAALDRMRVYESTMEVLRRDRGTPQQQEPPAAPEPRASELLRRRGVGPNDIYGDPDGYTDGLADVAVDRVMPAVREQTSQLAQKLEAMEQQLLHQRVHAAFLTAGSHLKANEAEWNEDADVISSYVVSRRLPIEDPNSYIQAANWFRAQVEKRSPKVTAALPPPLPVGGARTAPVPGVAPGRRLSKASKDQLSELTAIFGLDEKSTNEIEKDVLEHPRTRSFFQ